MTKKKVIYKTKGMNRDLSASSFNPSFSYENMNLRLSTKEGNTLMSWVNERGPLKLPLYINTKPWENGEELDTDIHGTPIGTAVINHQLVLFTTDRNSKEKPDYIYVFEYRDNYQGKGEKCLVGKLLYNGYLNFNYKHPLETLVYYESDNIEKVYWTDNYNQPRLINIKANKKKLRYWNDHAANANQEPDSYFDFVPTLHTDESLEVKKDSTGGGNFAPGVIQYCFSYFNNNGQQTNLAALSPLFYLGYADRGASPEDKVGGNFHITMKNLDPSYDSVRLYSIQRTSLNTDPVVKILEDIPIEESKGEKGEINYTASYTDNGTTGATLDPTELLYIGGKSISALTMIDKDSTLFLGNVTQKRTLMNDLQNYFKYKKKERENTLQWNKEHPNDKKEVPNTIEYKEDGKLKKLTLKHVNGVYGHTNQLKNWNEDDITTFKGGETYRFGIQLQKKTGEWLDPVYIDDVKNPYYPLTSMDTLLDKDGNAPIDTTHLVYAEKTLNLQTIEDAINGIKEGATEEERKNIVKKFDFSKFRRIRPVIVFPTIGDRNVICQGVLNPTVFNVEDRMTNSPFAQASWFFRPNIWRAGNGVIGEKKKFSRHAPGDTEADYEYTCISPSDDAQITLDEHFLGYDDPYYVYAMTVELSVDEGLEIIRKGYLTTVEGNNPPQVVYIFGGIQLKNPSDNKEKYTFVFLKGDKWELPRRPSYSSSSEIKSSFSYQFVSVDANDTVQTSGDEKFPILNQTYLHRDQDTGSFYYVKMKDAPDTQNNYTFEFAVDARDVQDTDTHTIQLKSAHYKVTFHAQEDKDNASDEGNNSNEIYNGLSGNYLSECHYSSIFTLDDIKAASGTKAYYTEAKNLEIQGAVKTYNTPYDNVKKKVHEKSNTQFFIDQSIVTLNSPDIEFDTDVQNLDCSNLAMRVIGAIPITGCASSHNIEINTAMLERGLDKVNASNVFVRLAMNRKEFLKEQGKRIQQFGNGELDKNVIYKNIPAPVSYGGKKLVADFLWNDVIVDRTVTKEKDDADKISTKTALIDYMVYPWQKEGSLNNDNRKGSETSSCLDVKKESNLLYSWVTRYIEPDMKGMDMDGNGKIVGENDIFPPHVVVFPDLDAQMILTENDEVMNYRLSKQCDTGTEINYYSNIDKVLVNSNGYNLITDSIVKDFQDKRLFISPVSMKYKSTAHAIIALDAPEATKDYYRPFIPILPEGNMSIHDYYYHSKEEDKASANFYNGLDANAGKFDIAKLDASDNQYIDLDSEWPTFWGDKYIKFKQDVIKTGMLFYSDSSEKDKENNIPYFTRPYSFLWLGELYRPKVVNQFGGSSAGALKANTWLIGGKEISLTDEKGDLKSEVTLDWTHGDTYYQRYDCLKTYAFTPEDTNQIIEILSFMCESHVNLDGRYDRNRGQMDNTDMHPKNFNILNSAYSQKDNFFTSNILNTGNNVNDLHYPNQVYYSKTKTSGADVDAYTNVTLASMLELEGDKGSLNALRKLSGNIIAFQDTGISQILYNENVQLATTNGVPVEIANSGKVQGARYLSNTIGCSNKWSMATTPSGIYFMDDTDRSIYLFNSQLKNLSTTFGFDSWSKQHIKGPKAEWNPVDFENFVTYYDKVNQDVLFISDEKALAYSEKIGAFSSFYSYNDIPYFVNLDNTGLWIKEDKTNKEKSLSAIYQHNEGAYGNFFGTVQPYWMTFVVSAEPAKDKLFTNLEFGAAVDGEGNVAEEKYTPTLPFDTLDAWNEYQHGTTKLANRKFNLTAIHHDKTKESALLRKFRIWHCDIPRDNAPLDSKEKADGLHIYRQKPRPMDRIRGPWAYLKLLKNADDAIKSEDKKLPRTELHDVVVTYFS